ncbi:hypothetical protein [Chryseobacterium binzhouense]|uniref:hypothetical protein n=1 Tax=Chryseobacterium binzhouense TaxID=2593646 RepID=UPI00289C6604|nr:hypothetical protein [Chryseobacterium binzhouense]
MSLEENECKAIFFRITTQRKKDWKNICKEKNISLTSLIIDSVENRMMDDERRKVLEFIEKQDNVFTKIETNINQVAKIVNTQKFINSKELDNFSEKLTEVSELKKMQNRIFEKIYALLAK